MTSRYCLTAQKFLNDEEFSRLRDLVKRRSPERDALLILLALKTGARASEILNVRKQDLNRFDQSVLIRGLKGSNDREIPVKPHFFNALWKFAHSQNTELIFNISYTRLVQIWDEYRPCEKPFKSIRHAFAMRLFAKTKDLRLVQVALGHRNILNTMIYADYYYTKNELRRLIVD